MESITITESHRKPIFGREWVVMVRVNHLPLTLRRDRDPRTGPVTFQVSTYLSNYSPDQARTALGHLAAGRCPVT